MPDLAASAQGDERDDGHEDDAAIAHHHVLMKPEMLSNIRVGSGSLAFSEAKKVRNFGSTNVARMITVAMAITATTAG